MRHNVINASRAKDLKLYAIYAPPEHVDEVVRRAKAEALTAPEKHDGRTTE